jgi:hypothetical protein
MRLSYHILLCDDQLMSFLSIISLNNRLALQFVFKAKERSLIYPGSLSLFCEFRGAA